MEGFLEHVPSAPFAALSALRAVLPPKRSAGFFPSRRSEAYTLAHGIWFRYGTDLSVL